MRILLVGPILALGLCAQAVIPEGAEPNSYPQFTAIQCGQQGDGVIGAAGDIDYWRVQVAGPMTLRVFVGPGATSPRLQDSQLEIRDAVNTLLESNDDGAGIGLYSDVRDFRIGAAGIYFIAVKGYLAYTGSYSLDVSCGAAGPAWVAAAEAPEPNNTNANATAGPAIGCWARVNGTIQFAGDVDRFAFPATAAQRITMTTGAGSSGSAISDTILTLRNAAGTVLASNDDSLGLYSRVSFVFPTSGTYYVDVSGYLNQVIGSYVLEFECSGALPYPSSLTTYGTGCLSSAGTVPRIQRRTNNSGQTYVERPLLGTVMVGEVALCPPLYPVFIAAGFQERNPPIDLGILGAPGCLSLINAIVLELQFANAGGLASWQLNVPNDTTLNGASVHYQAVVFDPTANALGLSFSNRAQAVVGNSF